jgi:hypothetical protein
MNYIKEFAVFALVASCGVAFVVMIAPKATPKVEQPMTETNGPVAMQSRGIKFTPRYPDATNDPRSDPMSPWHHEPFTNFRLKRAVTNDGLRHFGTLYIGPMRYLPPGDSWMYRYSPYRIEIPPGYKCVETNSQRVSRNSPVDILVIPKTPEDYAADEVRNEHNRIVNQQNDEHFRKTVREEMTKEGATTEEIDTWLAGWEQHRKLRASIGSDNYEKVLRSRVRAEREKLKREHPEQYEAWLKTLPRKDE